VSGNRFVVPCEVYNGLMLIISDYYWWDHNEREILNWMADRLPRGIDHQQGMVINFDSESDRVLFLLRWG
jgi:hypothetical protein